MPIVCHPWLDHASSISGGALKYGLYGSVKLYGLFGLDDRKVDLLAVGGVWLIGRAFFACLVAGFCVGLVF